jgi:hypothetical protein
MALSPKVRRRSGSAAAIAIAVTRARSSVLQEGGAPSSCRLVGREGAAGGWSVMLGGRGRMQFSFHSIVPMRPPTGLSAAQPDFGAPRHPPIAHGVSEATRQPAMALQAGPAAPCHPPSPTVFPRQPGNLLWPYKQVPPHHVIPHSPWYFHGSAPCLYEPLSPPRVILPSPTVFARRRVMVLQAVLAAPRRPLSCTVFSRQRAMAPRAAFSAPCQLPVVHGVFEAAGHGAASWSLRTASSAVVLGVFAVARYGSASRFLCAVSASRRPWCFRGNVSWCCKLVSPHLVIPCRQRCSRGNASWG